MSTDIDAILKDPLAASDADLAKMMAEAHGEDQAADPPEQPEGEAPQGDEPTAGKEAGQAEPQGVVEPVNAPIMTRDGKHQIPYSVLEAERRRANEASQRELAAQQLASQERSRSEALERQLAELSDKAKAVQEQAAGGKTDTTPGVESIISAEELEALRDDAPDLAAVFDRMKDAIVELQASATKSLETAERSQRELQDERNRRATEQVNEAIGNNPKLVYARAEKPEVFNAIVEVDDWVRQQPAFNGLPLGERFAKSVAMYEAAHGQINVPGHAKPDTKTVSDAAAAAIAKASATVPNTLSDLPGGSLPPKSEVDAIGSLNTVDLQQRLMDMDPGQIDKLLARLSL